VGPHSLPYVTGNRPHFLAQGNVANYGLGGDSPINVQYTDTSVPYGLTYNNMWTSQRNINAIYVIYGFSADPRSQVSTNTPFTVRLDIKANNFSNNSDSVEFSLIPKNFIVKILHILLIGVLVWNQ
jgi:hypothetical protein